MPKNIIPYKRAALLSFAKYAAKKDFSASLPFYSAMTASKKKREPGKLFVRYFTKEEIRLLLKIPVLRYLFEVSDTESGADARSPWLWEYREEYHDAVSAALEKRCERSGEDDMAARLEEISERLAQEFWNDRREDILDAVPGSFLDGFDEFNVEASFRRAFTYEGNRLPQKSHQRHQYRTH